MQDTFLQIPLPSSQDYVKLDRNGNTICFNLKDCRFIEKDCGEFDFKVKAQSYFSI